MSLLGDRVPTNLKIFLTALAIVDGIGAIVVIAMFYTESLSMVSLGLGALLLGAFVASNKLGVPDIRDPWLVAAALLELSADVWTDVRS